MKKGLTIGVLVLIILLVLIFSDKIIQFIIDIQWFKEVGYLQIYFTKINIMIKLMVPFFIFTYIIIYYFYKVMKNCLIDKRKTLKDNIKGKSIGIFIILNTALSIILSYLFASNYWYEILEFSKAKSFNKQDPIFGLDISFYIFRMPLIESLYKLLTASIIIFIIISAIIFLIGLSANRNINSNKESMKPLAIATILLMIIIGLGYILKSLRLVYSNTGLVYGASFTDVNISLFFYKTIAFLSFISSIVVAVSIYRLKLKPMIITASIIVFFIILEPISVFIVKEAFISSNEMTYERQYIKNNIEFTTEAFNINNMDKIEFNPSSDIKEKDIEENKNIINNLKINSYKQSLVTYNYAQVLRNYYQFNDIDLDRYSINGSYKQVLISPREMSSEGIESTTWVNSHLIYTHGYGVVMSSVSTTNEQGQPDSFIKGMPLENKSSIALENPKIYFGEKTSSYAIVKTKVNELDYPKGQSNALYKYDGNAGIPMSFINRIIFAIKEREINFLISTDINSNSKILINRNITERVNKIAPFLKYDSDPYMVISEGRLYWILDAYTCSDRYPCSQPYNNINYIRNSVKVVVDAFNGSVNYYIFDDSDPIINCYKDIFKGLFKNASDMPKDLMQHTKYPMDLFDLQCNVFGKYHASDPLVFINEEDLWTITKDNGFENSKSDSQYIVMKPSSKDKEEMVLLQYFNFNEKEDMKAIFGVRMDGKNYGKLFLYKLPNNKNISTPYLFKNKITQDDIISQEMSLWDTNSSGTEFGEVVIVPINDCLLYVVPMYLTVDGPKSIPELKRVIVSDGQKIVEGEDIDKAIEKLFNKIY